MNHNTILFNTFVCCAVFITTNASLLYASHLGSTRFLSNAPHSVRLVAIGTLFYSLIILIFQALSPLHAISKIWVTIFCLFLALISHILWGRHAKIQTDIEPIKLWIRDGLASRWAGLLIICGFVVLLSLSRAMLMPPLGWDDLLYHLPLAAKWIKRGTILFFKAPDVLAECTHYPINGELFASWLLLPFNNDLMTNIMNFPITMLGGIACYAIARELGLTRKEASWAPALICFAPVIYSEITTSQVDNSVFAFCSVAVLFTLRFIRKGYLYDFYLAFTSAGILLGIKYTAIPVVALICIAIIIKTIRQNKYTGFIEKLGLILLSLLILCMFGGRQYILNSIDARNPIYPFSLKIFNHEILEGSYNWEQMGTYVHYYEKETGQDKFNLWEKEYTKFCYLNKDNMPFPITLGPKFLIFIILAIASLFFRPQNVSKAIWYLLSLLWFLPTMIFVVDTSAATFRSGPFVEYSSRFLSPFLALFTVQGLIFIKKIRMHYGTIDLILFVFVAWDLLYINKAHLWEVEAIYPFFIAMLFLIVIFTDLLKKKSKPLNANKEISYNSYISYFQSLSILRAIFTRKCTAYITCLIALVIGLYFIQIYRDNTRYAYYRRHVNYVDIPRYFVNAWEFLDQPEEKKTIALTMGKELPSGNWFFYPLLGRHLQNDIVYISAKHKEEVPAWLDRGILRGYDFSIWLSNLKKKKVDCILVQKPWPIELNWMQLYPDDFQLVYEDDACKIFFTLYRISTKAS